MNAVRAQSLDAIDRTEGSRHVQHLEAIRLYDSKDLAGKSSLICSAMANEPNDGDTHTFVPHEPKPQTKATVSSILEKETNLPEFDTRRQLRIGIADSVPKSHERMKSPQISVRAPIPGILQAVNDLLPWEVPNKIQSTDRPRVQTQIEQRIKVSNTREESTIQSPAVQEADSKGQRAQLVTSANTEIAKNIEEENINKGKLAQEKRAKEEEAKRQRLVDRQERVKRGLAEDEARKKDMAEKLAQEEKAEIDRVEDEAQRKKLAEQELEEKAAKRRARRRELDAEKRLKNAIDQKAREEQLTVDNDDNRPAVKVSLVDTSVKGDKGLSTTLGTRRKTTSPALKVKSVKSTRQGKTPDVGSEKSSTPSILPSEPNRVRSSMTPVVPGSVTKLSGPGKSPATSNLNAQPLLRSALRQTPNVSRRSVSFMETASDSIKLDSSPSTTAASRMHSAKSGQTPINAVKHSKSRASSTVESAKSSSRSTSNESKELPKKTTPKEKVQTKLHIQRDMKLKGRLVDPPKTPSLVAPEEIVITSDSEASVSTFYEDEEDRPHNTKAGPSSKKKSTITKASSINRAKTSTLSDRSSGKCWNSSSQRSTPSSVKAAVKAGPEMPARGKSPSRSPAQYMSAAVSASSNSGSGSGSDSVSDSGTGSSSEPHPTNESNVLPLVAPEGGEAKRTRQRSSSSEDIEMEDADSFGSTSSGLGLHSPRMSSIEALRSRSSEDDDPRYLARDADQQLLRENYQPTSSSSSEIAKPRDRQNAGEKVFRQDSPERHHSIRPGEKSSNDSKPVSSKKDSNIEPKRTPGVNGSSQSSFRPGKQRYASLKDQMKESKGDSKHQTMGSKSASIVNSDADASMRLLSNSETSASDSDDDDDDDSDDELPAKSTKSQRNAIRGVKGVIKRIFPQINSA